MADPESAFDVAWLSVMEDGADALQHAVLERVTEQAEGAAAHHAVAGGGTSALAAMQAMRSLPSQRRAAIMLHPAFRYWLQAMRRTARGEEEGLRQRYVDEGPGFVWPALLLEGRLDRPWHVPTDQRGGLRCVGLGRFVELGSDYANQQVRILPGDGAALIVAPDGLTVEVPAEDLEGPPPAETPVIALHGYSLTMSPLLAGGRIEASTRDPWLRVRLTGTNQRTDGTAFHGADDTAFADTPDVAAVEAGLALLGRHWPAALSELAAFTRVIVPLGDGRHGLPALGDEARHTAFTVSSRQGAVYVSGAPPAAMVEMLLHENAHVKLRQIQALDPLLEDPFDETLRVQVPWRPDRRPLPGILEGLFVFLHVAEFERRHAAGGGGDAVLASAKRRLRDLRHAYAVLHEHARLTPGGAVFLSAMRAWLERMEASAPAPMPAR